MRKLALTLTLAACALTSRGPSAAEQGDEIVVVVNKANPAKALTREALRPIFQTTKTQWPDGIKAEPVNQPDDCSARQGFDAAVLGLDPTRVARYWVDRKIRGGEHPPRKVASPAAILRVVASEQGGVGYVMVKEVNDSVKVVAKIRNGQVVAP
jgi:ABC-type phosphate transport system substrate-binding protein